ncbi:CD3337/EF1877 family mobilome membrane protein [Oceanobacillus oncorhynchi]|uniref:CD3337/EF1877 family mobilome membrane protein n=1 Tax=Oceanobacillus oncorhynchi TaxID=545501 RepID=UPI001868D4A8|nr:hypothetical protein [Oceanobacillus oncorhynchi]
MKIKIGVSLLLIIITFFTFTSTISANTYGEFKGDENVHYYLEVVPDNADDDYFDGGDNGNGFWNWLTDFKDSLGDQITIMLNVFANIGLEFNIMMTSFMIWTLDFAFQFEYVNDLIDELSSVMQKISGVSGGQFGSSGIFGSLAIFISVLAIGYAVFILLFKRSMFKSLGAIVQTTLCLTLAILLFTNYATFLKGINQVTTELSALLLSGESIEEEEVYDYENQTPLPPEHEGDSPTGLGEESLRGEMKDNLWSMFVDRPYLYMMYGDTEIVDDIEEAGDDLLTKDRVTSLTQHPKGSDERLAVLKEENDKDNPFILYSNVTNRIVFTPMYLGINGLMSFFVFGLALALIAVQFWFLLIALFAPFALLLGAIPGMFNVLTRFSIELILPLAVKILLSFGALMIFMLSDVLFTLNFNIGNSVGQMTDGVLTSLAYYFLAAIVNLVLFALLFILRKRISSIFTKSNSFISEVKDGASQVTEPIKKSIQGAATVTGAAVGGATGGFYGATIGAQAGSVLGKTATGEGNTQDYAQLAGTIARGQMYANVGKSAGTKFGNGKSNKAPDDGIPPGGGGPPNDGDGPPPPPPGGDPPDDDGGPPPPPPGGGSPDDGGGPPPPPPGGGGAVVYPKMDNVPSDDGEEFTNLDAQPYQPTNQNVEDAPEQDVNYFASLDDTMPPGNYNQDNRSGYNNEMNDFDADHSINEKYNTYSKMENVPDNSEQTYANLQLNDNKTPPNNIKGKVFQNDDIQSTDIPNNKFQSNNIQSNDINTRNNSTENNFENDVPNLNNEPISNDNQYNQSFEENQNHNLTNQDQPKPNNSNEREQTYTNLNTTGNSNEFDSTD